MTKRTSPCRTREPSLKGAFSMRPLTRAETFAVSGDCRCPVYSSQSVTSRSSGSVTVTLGGGGAGGGACFPHPRGRKAARSRRAETRRSLSSRGGRGRLAAGWAGGDHRRTKVFVCRHENGRHDQSGGRWPPLSCRGVPVMAGFEIAEDFQIVLDPGFKEHPEADRVDSAGQLRGVHGGDRSIAERVDDRGFHVFPSRVNQFLAAGPDALVLSGQFRADGGVRAAADVAKLLRFLALNLQDVVAPAVEPFQRGCFRREDFFEDGLHGLPAFPVGLDGQVGFRREKMIKAAFIDPRALADVIHADRPVTAVPNQIESHFEQLLPGIGGFLHGVNGLRLVEFRAGTPIVDLY